MSSPGDGRRRYQVHCSGAITKIIRHIHRQATVQGRGKLVTKAFRQILLQLEVDPFRLGEPAYRLSSLRMQVRTVIARPLVVDFAVCENRPRVFIKGVKLMSGQA
jgi:hypothetical protein